MKPELVGDLGSVHRVWQVLLVGEDQEHGLPDKKYVKTKNLETEPLFRINAVSSNMLGTDINSRAYSKTQHVFRI